MVSSQIDHVVEERVSKIVILNQNTEYGSRRVGLQAEQSDGGQQRHPGQARRRRRQRLPRVPCHLVRLGPLVANGRDPLQGRRDPRRSRSIS